jgi:iron complex outermembrane receptor protein
MPPQGSRAGLDFGPPKPGFVSSFRGFTRKWLDERLVLAMLFPTNSARGSERPPHPRRAHWRHAGGTGSRGSEGGSSMDFRTVAAGMIVISSAALADSDAPVLERVEVVGSRVPRLDGETALPVQIIRREEIERSGVATTEELLTLVSANFAGVTEAGSTAKSGVSGVSKASLRGLGGTRTLVMLNGRRIDDYVFRGRFGAGVDLHAIPLAAIERVEVLKDGASALYGTDAIGGVINFITRREFAGVDVFASFTKTEDGGANSGRATLTGGTGRLESDGFNAFGVLDLRKAERLRGSDRPFSQMPFGPDLNFQTGDPRTWPSSVVFLNQNGTLKRLVSPNVGPECTASSYRYLNAVSDLQSCRFNDALASDLLPSSRQVGFFGTGTLRLTAVTNLYTEVLASQNLIGHMDPPTPVATGAAQHGTVFTLPTSSPYYPTDPSLQPPNDNWTLLYRALPLGPETTQVDSRNVKLLAGIRSQQWGWDLDAAVSTNRSWARETYVSGMVDATKIQAALATGLVNPFGPSGPDGDALLAASEVRGLSRESTGLTQSVDLRAVRLLTELPGGSLGLALGVEARRETLDDVEMPIAFDVLDDFPSAPKQGSRHVQGAYAEIVAPVLKGLEFQVAGRVDHYSDFGTAFSPKVAIRFEATSGVLLRASAGRGFRAPSLNELFAQQIHSPAGLLFNPDPVRCPVTQLKSDCNPTVDVVTGGNPALKPQRSTQTNLGIVVAPAPGWLASLDLWRIYIDSNITAVNSNTIIANLARYDGSLVVRGPVDPAFPNLPGPLVRINAQNENLGDWRVSGADVSLQTPKPTTELGRIWARVDATYVQYAKQNLTNITTIDQVGAVSPRWQSVASFNLDRNFWVATLLYRYRHGYDEVSLLADGPPTRHVPAYQLWDAHAIFTVGRNVKLLLGVENLLNAAPPLSITGDLLGYDPSYGDPRGRRWTVGLRASWP